MADPLVKKVDIYADYYRSSEDSLPPKHKENQSPPTMKQGMPSSSTSSTSAVKALNILTLK